MKHRFLVALAALLFTASAHAALISVTAGVAWYAVKFEENGYAVERGYMNFVYDTSTPDSDPDPNRGVYDNALVSFTMTVQQLNRPDLFFTLSPDPNVVSAGLGFVDGHLDSKWVVLELWATEHSGVYGPNSNMPVTLTLYATGFHADDSLPGLSYWNSESHPPTPFGARAGPAMNHDWGDSIRAIELPLPGTVPAIALGLLGMACIGRRKVRAARWLR